MSKAAELLTYLRVEGFTLTARSGNVVISPSDRLTPALTAAIREHKPALLDLLRPDRTPSLQELFIAGHTPEHRAEVIIKVGKGQWKTVSLEEYQRAVSEGENNRC